MKNRLTVFLGLIFLILISSMLTQIVISNFGFIYNINLGICTQEDMDFFRNFVNSKYILKQTFYKDIDDSELYDGALKGMVSAVEDPYTTYLNEKDTEELYESIEHKYEGIGVYLQEDKEDNTIKVVKVIPNGPAEAVGIISEDKIIKVDGIEYTGAQIDEAVSQIKKTSGSRVKLTILRNTEIKEFELQCQQVEIETVQSEIIENIGYIQISEFGDGTANEFKTHYENLESQKVKGYIIDLRNNTGGVYEEVVEIAKILVPKGLIVYTQYKDGTKEEEFSESNGIGKPLVVLINEYSASASEVLAGAIKDRGCGTLVGTKSYGKGVIQGVYNLPDGMSMKVTIAEYYTPNGINIDGIGIEPDIEVKVTTNTKDQQLEKAISLLK